MTPDELIAHCAAKGIPVTVGQPVRMDYGHPVLVPAEVASRVRGRAQVVPGKRAFVELAIPPSTNALFVAVPAKDGKKAFRVKSKAYLAWIKAAEFDLWGLSIPPAPWSVRLTVCNGIGWNEARDLDNAIKPCLDLLVSSGLLTDDNCRCVRSVSISYDPECRPLDVAKLRIEVRQWSMGG